MLRYLPNTLTLSRLMYHRQINSPKQATPTLRKWTSLILTVVVVFQSVVAMADAHQSHQSGSDHVEFEHEHRAGSDRPVNNLEETTSAVSPVQFDCHHCCHCHGMSSVFLAAHSFGLPLSWSNQTVKYRSVEYLSLSPSPGLRPPIA
jgi:hypothetical protein